MNLLNLKKPKLWMACIKNKNDFNLLKKIFIFLHSKKN